MLKYVDDRASVVNKIAISTSCEAFTELLQHLLQLWKFEIQNMGDADVLLLVEEGSAEPVAGQKTIRLMLPLELEKLWQIMEQHFHQPPRRHIRVDIELPVVIRVNDEKVSTTLNSLSDMGARFKYYRELVRDEPLSMSLNIGREHLQIDSRVIYAIQQSATAADEVRVGVIFPGSKKAQRDLLRSFIILSYLDQVRERMVKDRYDEALGFLLLPV